MSTIYNVGTIISNKPFTEEVKNRIREIMELSSNDHYSWIENDAIELTEYYGGDFNYVIQDVINAIEPDGYVLNGTVNYYGDYGDGRTEIVDNDVSLLFADEYWRHDASDDELIAVLEERGYIVTRK